MPACRLPADSTAQRGPHPCLLDQRFARLLLLMRFALVGFLSLFRCSPAVSLSLLRAASLAGQPVCHRQPCLRRQLDVPVGRWLGQTASPAGLHDPARVIVKVGQCGEHRLAVPVLAGGRVFVLPVLHPSVGGRVWTFFCRSQALACLHFTVRSTQPGLMHCHQ